jgi:hypothetical protein
MDRQKQALVAIGTILLILALLFVATLLTALTA